MRFCVCNTQTPTPTPPCPSDEACIQLCSPIVKCADAVGPCTETGQTDISTLDHDFTGCGNNTPVYVLVEFDTNYFTDMTLTEAGVLTWTTGLTSVAGMYGEFVFRVYCGEDLSSYQVGLICVKDPCKNITCAPGKKCYVCDGSCVDQASDLSITKTGSDAVLIGSADLSISKSSS